MEQEEKSLTWVVATLMATIAVLGWGFLAGSYEGANPSRDHWNDFDRPSSGRGRGGLALFAANAVEQLPNLPAVLSWHFSNRIWLPIVILILEGVALGGGIALHRAGDQLGKPKRRRK